VLLLPGPPRELTPMMDRFAREVLGLRVGDERLHRRVIKVTGRTESHVEELTRRVYTRWTEGAPPVWTTILSTPGQIELHLSVRTADEATARDRLAACEDEIAAVLGPYIFSTDGRELEQVVGDLLRERGLTVAVAESCTGGLLMSRLTDVPGSSAYLLAGVVAYGNRSKVELVGVPESLIAEHGAVSEPVARAMAAGARARGCAEIGVGVTGIAGPSGATVGKPVGTVCLAVVGPEGSGVARTLLFPGGRSVVKFQAAQAALDQLRRTILGTDRS
jgi:nicotinamide-nucleotide amidase